jgi:hypothetical protein
MHRLALALLILTATPAAAHAAPFGELPALAVKTPARCLRATGAPGEVVRWAPDGAEFLQATASGFGAPVHVPLGDRFGECPLAMAQPSGAGVVTERLDDGIAVAARDPGGSWGAAQTFSAGSRSTEVPAAAVTSRGDAVVAWTETQDAGHDAAAARVLIARRPAGGTFGAPIAVTPLKTYELAPPRVAVGIQDDGTVTVLWSTEGAKASDRERLFAAVAPPGAPPLGPPQLLSEKLALHEFSLTVAPDGRALAIAEEGAHTRVLERPPGGTFAQVAAFGYTESLLGGAPTAVLRPDGAAIVAWEDILDVQMFVMRRNGPGAFGRPEKVGAKPPDPYAQELEDFDGGAPAEDGGRGPRAAFAPDGRPVLTWAPAHALGGLTWTAATVATFPGGVQALGGPLRDADSVTPVVLPDGRAGVAWSDVSQGGEPRLHLAIEGAAASPEPPAPRIGIGRIAQIPHGLVIPFRCSAACDVRATVPDGIGGRRSLPGAGSGRLKLVPEYDPIILRRPDSVPVQVLTGAPGARTVTNRKLTAKLRDPRLPRFLGLKAVRRGKKIAVSWHTDRPLRKATVLAAPSESRAFDPPFLAATVEGEGRRRFRVNVEPVLGDRYVQLYLVYQPAATERRIAVVPVTRAG